MLGFGRWMDGLLVGSKAWIDDSRLFILSFLLDECAHVVYVIFI